MDPLSKRLWRNAGTDSPRRIPALCYHATPLHRSDRRSRYDVQKARFEQHLDLLKDSGWSTLSLKDFLTLSQLPPRSVLLTFDDGYANNLPGALEPLARRGMRACWFITTAPLTPRGFAPHAPPFEHATIDKGALLALRAAGMDIGSHTVTHPDLTTVDDAALAAELGDSRPILENILGEPVETFAYPYGRYDLRVTRAAMQSGYLAAFTTRSGSNMPLTPRMELRRLTVYGTDDVATLARKLSLADTNGSWSRVATYGMQAIGRRLGLYRG